MFRYRLRIILLSLGVALGYGSAIVHFARASNRFHSAHNHCEHFPWFDSEHPKGAAKKVQ